MTWFEWVFLIGVSLSSRQAIMLIIDLAKNRPIRPTSQHPVLSQRSVDWVKEHDK
jgi:hypothetical protein